jgi:hypothetical protein
MLLPMLALFHKDFDMPDNSNFIKLILESGLGWFWFVFLAIWGGTVNYISRIKKNGMKFSIVELVGEWTISGFSGLITGFICMHYNVPIYMTFVSVAIAGHAGGKTIHALENHYWKKPDGSQ